MPTQAEHYLAAIFDVEGTLVDCVPLQLESWRATLAAAGHTFSLAELQSYSGMDGTWMLDQLLPEESADTRQQLVKHQGELYKAEYLDRVQPFPAVRDLFVTLKQQGVALGIATSCQPDELHAYDRLIHVLDLVDAIACGDMVKHGKPDPALFSSCARRLAETHPGRAIAIGDTPYDARAAKLAGIQAAGVLTGGFPRATLLESGCGSVFAQVREVSTLWGLPSKPRVQLI
ncbi:MAG: HAD family hydrolase [Sinobacteraceae bacterium]|nr:HAD family hydrolase [Nevskiaceae bacterium]